MSVEKIQRWRLILGKSADALRPTLARDPSGDIDERVPLADVKQALKEKGITKAAVKEAKSPADKSAALEAKAHKRRQAAVKAALAG